MAMNEEMTAEQIILERAIQALEHETGLHLRIEQYEDQQGAHPIHAIVALEPGNHLFTVRIKKWAQHGNLGALINQVKQLPGEGLLVADYINPRMVDTLRRQNIQFIDAAGNAFISQPAVHVHVKGRRQQQVGFASNRDGAKRAFESAGLKVVYAFLCHPGLVNKAYREIAEQAGVSLGTVGSVLNGLKAGGFIHDQGGRQGRGLAHYQKLLDRWVDVYPEKLKPKQWLGDFVAADPYWWKRVDIQRYDGYWGGEIAAASYSDWLKPQVATLYLPEQARNHLLGDSRLRKMTEWRDERQSVVHIYQPFWPVWLDDVDGVPKKGLVHPVLAYADLLATGDPRNRDAAQRIHDQYIAQYSGED